MFVIEISIMKPQLYTLSIILLYSSYWKIISTLLHWPLLLVIISLHNIFMNKAFLLQILWRECDAFYMSTRSATVCFRSGYSIFYWEHPHINHQQAVSQTHKRHRLMFKIKHPVQISNGKNSKRAVNCNRLSKCAGTKLCTCYRQGLKWSGPKQHLGCDMTEMCPAGSAIQDLTKHRLFIHRFLKIIHAALQTAKT